MLCTIKGRRGTWIGHTLRRNCLIKHIIEGKIEGWIEVTERQGRRRKKLFDDRKKTRACWMLENEALDHTV
jgi:hypothetical protein